MQVYKLDKDHFLRIATLDDVPQLLELTLAGLKDTPYGAQVVEPKYLEGFIKNLLSDPSRTIVIVLLKGNEIVGLIAGAVNREHPVFNKVGVAGELFWYVVPSARGKFSEKLVEAYEEWAKVVGCKFVSMVHFEGTPKLDKLYEARGYKPYEVAYLKEI